MEFLNDILLPAEEFQAVEADFQKMMHKEAKPNVVEVKGSKMTITTANEETTNPANAVPEDESRGLIIFISALMFGVWLLVLGAHL